MEGGWMGLKFLESMCGHVVAYAKIKRDKDFTVANDNIEHQ